MGIVVCIALLLSVYYLWMTIRKSEESTISQPGQRAVAIFAIVAGLWNVLWFGLRNWELFWGQVAIVSGIFLVFAGLQLWLVMSNEDSSLLKSIEATLYRVRYLTLTVVAASALLYLVTLVQLNLGFEILR